MEEFGVSSDFASDANAATYYRHLRHPAGRGDRLIGRNNTDFALPASDPYRHHAFEQNFGLTDAHGRPKPALREMRNFARTLATIDHTRIGRADTDTALIVSSYLDTQYPFTSPDTHVVVANSLHQGYVAARLADLPPRLTRETTGIEDGARLYLAPSAKQFLASTAARLEELASRDGATVYVSYCAGDVAWHRGPSYGSMNELFKLSTSSTWGSATRSRTTWCESPSPATSAASPGTRPSTSRRQATSTPAPTCPSPRPRPRSSPPTPTAARRC